MKFDRTNPQSELLLNSLRGPGKKRKDAFTGHGGVVMSENLQALFCGVQYRNQVRLGDTFIDLGCGESPDARIMSKCFGYESYGVDMFPLETWMNVYKNQSKTKFILGDFLEEETWNKLPKANIISMYAVFALVKPEERNTLFKFIYDHLEDRGILVVNKLDLKTGYGQAFVGKGFDIYGDYRSKGFTLQEREPTNHGFGFCGFGGFKSANIFQKEL